MSSASSYYTAMDDELFSLSFSDRSLEQVPMISRSVSESTYSSSASSYKEVLANTPLLAQSYFDYMGKNDTSPVNTEYSNDIFQLDDINMEQTQQTNKVSIDNNQSINFDPFYDTFANAAQQNYRIWVSSV